MPNDQVYLTCYKTPYNNTSRMFVEGGVYKAYDNGLTYHVIDALGCVRVVSKSDMSFMVSNDGFGMIGHAHFSID